MFLKPKKKVFVIGLDCAPPKLLFEEFKEYLPNLGMLIDNGLSCRMRSIHPPITIPAWMSMCSGNDAGQIGVYGFRTRVGNSYTQFDISTSLKFSRIEKIWDVLARHKKKSILVGIPPTYPVYPIDGCMISGFICPDAQRDFTYPKELKSEIEKLVGEYLFDVVFRTEDRDQLLNNAWEMTNKRFKVIEYLLKNKKWDFFMFVEIGVDRIQHAFWKYYDRTHRLYEPSHKHKDTILNYYKLIDEKVGRILSCLDKDTTVFVVSDHGAKAMKGSFCINEWLIKKGYLVLNKYPERIEQFDKLDINWKKTKVWGWGGYYGRIFINRKGREDEGIVEDDEYEQLRDKIISQLQEEVDQFGNKWDTKVYKPEQLYKTLNGDTCDLMAYFDDLAYRSAGTVGHNSLFLNKNDTGPDDAMHDWEGVFVKYDPRDRKKIQSDALSLLDFKSQVLKAMGIDSGSPPAGR
ncbi:MAG: alkaline phosphatase family protein [Candidatus Omnitrophica bacterium]|nr:alkaline phosphatase family protein [Candidatus Omnitrophota bacterium]